MVNNHKRFSLFNICQNRHKSQPIYGPDDKLMNRVGRQIDLKSDEVTFGCRV